MSELRQLVKMYKVFNEMMESIEKVFGVDFRYDSQMWEVYSYFEDKIAAYSPDYTALRWENEDWFQEYIGELLEDIESIDETVKKILNGVDETIDISFLNLEDRRLVKQVNGAIYDIKEYEKMLDEEEAVNPISDRARRLATEIESKKRYVERMQKMLKEKLGESYNKLSRLMRM